MEVRKFLVEVCWVAPLVGKGPVDAGGEARKGCVVGRLCKLAPGESAKSHCPVSPTASSTRHLCQKLT
jgi:hypothetical protein